MDHYDDRGAARALDDDHEAEDDRAPRVRGRTISVKRLSKRDLDAGRREADALLEGLDAQRPTTRADCLEGGSNAERPCPWVSCKHHLALDVNPRSGAIKLNFPALEVWELPETCALDVADRGGITLEEVGEVVNLTRERTRQLETRGLAALAPLARLAGLNEDLRERARPDLAPRSVVTEETREALRRGALKTHESLQMGPLSAAAIARLRELRQSERLRDLATRLHMAQDTILHALAGEPVSARVRAVLEAL